MKHNLLQLSTLFFLLLYTALGTAQISLGTSSTYVLFTTNGAVGNTGITHLTGNVGSNNGSSTGFGNVNGVMNNNNGSTGAAAADLLIAYNQMNTAIATFFPAPLLGNGQTLTAGIYAIAGNATLNQTLTLNGQSNPNAVFIIQIAGSFASAANAKVVLSNGALACNVFWKVEGQIDLAAGTTMRGTLVANNAAININSGVILEGRALSTTGAISIDNAKAYTPVGCGSPLLTGPASPTLGTATCYALFSANGPVSNSGNTFANGDIGTNVGLTTGFNALNVTGAIHPIPDGSTGACATDLLTAYNYLNTLAYDIELLYPAQFGMNLVLTPHTYVMNGAAMFVDTLFLNAQGNSAARFVIQINGALTTGTYAKVSLMNGAQASNVFWKIDGAVDIDDYSEFVGTIVCNNGAIDLGTGVTLNGRALTTNGALATTAVTVTMPPGCNSLPNAPSISTQPVNKTACEGASVSFSVAASGSPLTYQWKKGAVVLTNGGNISGATTATLVINPAGAGDISSLYHVIVSTSPTTKDTSDQVSLTINLLPVISVQPADQISCLNGSAQFSTNATGTGVTYQWRKGSTNLTDGGNISGATTASLTINPISASDLASNYNVVASGVCSPASTSDNAALLECSTVGLSQNEKTINSANIFPNPFSSNINIKMAEAGLYEFRLYNLVGLEVMNIQFNGNQHSFDGSVLADGIYYYAISGQGVSQTGKIVSLK